MSARDIAALEQTTLAGLELDARAMEHLPEARLISRLRVGDLAAFEDLVAHFERSVYALCFRFLGDAEEARDAAGDLPGRSPRAGRSGRGRIESLTHRTINQAMNQKLCRRHRDETLSLDIARGPGETTLGNSLPGRARSPEADAISSEREHCIMLALAEIKQEYRIALMLREIEELSYEEIADTLAISIGTVKSRIARGREELRRRVKDLV
jgi:RNA polymerase sigma-70 factor (ECF subfamily)